MDLVTLSEYKNYMGITNPNDDVKLNIIIPKVSKFIKTYCKRSFVDYFDESKVETFSGGTNSLFLSETPIVAVDSLEYSSDYGQNYVTLAEFVDYVVDVEYDMLVSLVSTGFPKLVNGYKVTYKAGYETIPEDLKLAVMDMVTYYLKNDMAVHSPKAPGTNTVQIEYVTSSALPAHIKRVLDQYVAHYG